MRESGHHAPFKLTVANLTCELQVLSLSGREAINQPFSFDVELVSSQAELPLERLLHKPAFLQLSPDGRGIHGQICCAAQADSGKRLHHYAVTLAPQLAALAKSSNQYIFQNIAVPEIIAEVLQQHGIRANACFRLSTTYPDRAYCVQYQESDLHFIQRLCEEEGLHFHFEHSPTAHVLVFGDDQTGFPKLNPEIYRQSSGMTPGSPTITRFDLLTEVRTRRTTLRDHSFEKPALELESSAHDKAAGEFEHYDFPGRFSDRTRGRLLASRALERLRTDSRLAQGESDQPQLVSGHFLPLSQHTDTTCNGLWLLTEVIHEGKQPQVLEESIVSDRARSADEFQQGYRNRFLATPWKAPNRPSLGHLKPLTLCSQTATVSGPEGQEIHCDEFGRVKVQFHWDRQGQGDGSSSCWLRVCSTWAGARYGGVAIPRIGMEVLVGFFEGDPDQPMVIGCLPNEQNRPANELPADKTRSLFKTLSSAGGDGSNEIRIEDRKDHEEIFVHAQRDWVEHIQHDKVMRVGNELHETVQANTYNDLKAQDHQIVDAQRRIEARADDHLTVEGELHTAIGISQRLEVGQEIHLSSGLKLVLDAGSELTLKAAGHFMKIHRGGVVLSGTRLNLNAGSSSGVTVQAKPLLPAKPQQAESALPGRVLVPAQRQALMRKMPRCQVCEQSFANAAMRQDQ